jgi:hypothetical protein
MNLIVQAALVEPPSQDLSFRYVSLVARKELNLDCLIEVEQEMKDTYYKYLLNHGLFDFFQGIIIPEERVPGLRLGETVTEPPAIKLKAIRADSVVHLIGMIKYTVLNGRA